MRQRSAQRARTGASRRVPPAAPPERLGRGHPTSSTSEEPRWRPRGSVGARGAVELACWCCAARVRARPRLPRLQQGVRRWASSPAPAGWFASIGMRWPALQARAGRRDRDRRRGAVRARAAHAVRRRRDDRRDGRWPAGRPTARTASSSSTSGLGVPCSHRRRRLGGRHDRSGRRSASTTPSASTGRLGRLDRCRDRRSARRRRRRSPSWPCATDHPPRRREMQVMAGPTTEQPPLRRRLGGSCWLSPSSASPSPRSGCGRCSSPRRRR